MLQYFYILRSASLAALRYCDALEISSTFACCSSIFLDVWARFWTFCFALGNLHYSKEGLNARLTTARTFFQSVFFYLFVFMLSLGSHVNGTCLGNYLTEGTLISRIAHGILFGSVESFPLVGCFFVCYSLSWSIGLVKVYVPLVLVSQTYRKIYISILVYLNSFALIDHFCLPRSVVFQEIHCTIKRTDLSFWCMEWFQESVTSI